MSSLSNNPAPVNNTRRRTKYTGRPGFVPYTGIPKCKKCKHFPATYAGGVCKFCFYEAAEKARRQQPTNNHRGR
jgi:hypothetical protein